MDLLAGLIIGLFGSLHCVGMCGPLVLALPLTQRDRIDIATKSLVYNLGRIFTYGVLGFLMGFLGWGLEIGGLQKIFSIILGLTLLYSALLNYFPSFSLRKISHQLQFMSAFNDGVKKRLILSTNSNAISIGMLNGLLPCGLVYVALASSVTQADPLSSSLYMMLFGLGTLPLMFLVMYGGNLYKGYINRLRRFIPLVLGLLGVYLIYRGMALQLTNNPGDIVNGLFKISCH